LYAKYYFELRALFKDSEKEFPLKALDKKDADNLEIRSRDYKNHFEVENQPKKLNLTGNYERPEWK